MSQPELEKCFMPEAVKVHVLAELIVKDTLNEALSFSLFLEGVNKSWPGATFPVRTLEAKNSPVSPWLAFAAWLYEYRQTHLGELPLIGFVFAENHEETPVPLIQLEQVIGMVCSTFGLPRSPHVENEPSMPDLALV
jgi:hypothetical protein